MRLVHVAAKSVALAWEHSLLLAWATGDIVETEYGQRAKEVAAVIEVQDPFSEPRYHLKGIVGSVEEYVAEVVDGVNDHLVARFGYTYHDRLTRFHGLDQLKAVAGKLLNAPYTRRGVCVTWHPATDLFSEHPPCLIYLWFHSPDGERLVLHAHMRSNDALKAALMNMLAFTELQRRIAESVYMKVGEYIHIVDSFHIYENDWKYVAAMYTAREEEREKWRLSTEQYRRFFSRKRGGRKDASIITSLR
ncbi:MAG: thymidylate synthase [Thermofilaceae archaeon]